MALNFNVAYKDEHLSEVQNTSLDIDVESMRKITTESEQRCSRRKQIEVLPYTPSDINSDYHLLWAGTVGIFIAKKGSKILERIKKAALEKSSDDIEIAKEITELYSSREKMSYKDAADLVMNQDVFADISYGGRLIYQNGTILKDVPICATGVPYNGGKIYGDAFQLIEHFNEDSEIELDAVILYRVPKLTAAEKKALDSLNPDDEWFNIGKHTMCFAVSGVTIYATVCAACALCCRTSTFTKRGILNPNMRDELVKKLTPIATAKELLKIRREVLCS